MILKFLNGEQRNENPVCGSGRINVFRLWTLAAWTFPSFFSWLSCLYLAFGKNSSSKIFLRSFFRPDNFFSYISPFLSGSLKIFVEFFFSFFFFFFGNFSVGDPPTHFRLSIRDFMLKPLKIGKKLWIIYKIFSK